MGMSILLVIDTLIDQYAERQSRNAVNPCNLLADEGTLGPNSATALNVPKLAIAPINLYLNIVLLSSLFKQLAKYMPC